MVKDSMDLLELLRKSGVDGDVDFLREALRVLMDAIMDAEVSARIGAEHGERSPDRLTHRNGYRSRTWTGRQPSIPGSERWSFAYRSSGKGVTFRVCWSLGAAASVLCWR